jgi:hypothetical protein
MVGSQVKRRRNRFRIVFSSIRTQDSNNLDNPRLIKKVPNRLFRGLLLYAI